MTPKEAYYKARESVKRIPEFELELELEPLISKDAYWSYLYARNIIKGRWELAEPFILKDAYYSYLYALNVIKGRWELGEPTISKDAKYSYWYATDLIKGKLPDFMHNQMIFSNDEYTKQYVEYIE